MAFTAQSSGQSSECPRDRFLHQFAALISGCGLLLSYGYGPTSGIHDPVVRLVHFFSYFTILTNSTAFLILLAVGLFPQNRLARSFGGLGVRTQMLAMFAIVVVIYHTLLLPDLFHRKGLGLLASILCHMVSPAFFALLWWRAKVTPALIRFRDLAWGSLLLFVYAAWLIANGHATGWYPYPFADVSRLGLWSVLRAFFAVQLIYWLAAIGLRHIMDSRGHHPNQS